jgi:hypothetical protein
MIKNLRAGTATFQVNVEEAGDYAVNISHMNGEQTAGKTGRTLVVQVDSNPAVNIKGFRKTGNGCNNAGGPGAGATSVVAIELEGFNANDNEITFGGGALDVLQIEWISVVPKVRSP